MTTQPQTPQALTTAEREAQHALAKRIVIGQGWYPDGGVAAAKYLLWLESRCADLETDKKALIAGDVRRDDTGGDYWIIRGAFSRHPDPDSALRAFHASQSRTTEASNG